MPRTIFGRAVTILAATTLLVVMGEAAVTYAKDAPPISSFLLKRGEAPGITPGKAQIFRTVTAVRNGAGEGPTLADIRRYEAEGFVEAAMVRLHIQHEPAAKGISSVFDFETAAGAKAEMRSELKEEFNRGAASPKYLVLRRFKVPGVREAVVSEYVTSEAASSIGLESEVSNVF